jgi:2-pyrone-4,6-dicarboxylate lactonase
MKTSASPKRPLPPGAWDTHAHVFGPYDHFPLAKDRAYEPPLAPYEDYVAMLDRIGFSRGVLVHAGANGFDCSATRDALTRAQGRVRGVAVIAPESTASDLEKLRIDGFSAVRFTEMGATVGARRPYTLIFEDMKRMAPTLRELGMHAQIWSRCELFVSEAPKLLKLGIPIVIDHMGSFDAARGVDDPAFKSFLALLDEGTIWVKLTPIRNSKAYPDYADVRAFHDALVDKASDRLLWGSDWPYIGMETKPTVEHLLDLFDNWLNDDSLRQKIFVSNPNALFKSIK